MSYEKAKAKNTPKAIEIWLKLVRVPEIYLGESYFMIRGVRELYKPAQIPWISLHKSNVYARG
jgi:hypothetical protein